jgi:hypothetical protein
MGRFSRSVAIVSVTVAMLTTPTLAAASVPAAPAVSTGSAWLTLGALSTTGATNMAGATVAAAQPMDMGPPPPPQPRPVIGTPPVPILVYWLGVVAAMVYIASLNGHDHVRPNSPA